MSGSGKSTLLRYISALQEPTEGQVLVHGKPGGPDTHISMVFQQYSSLPWMTVLDNVGLALQYQGMSKKDEGGKPRDDRKGGAKFDRNKDRGDSKPKSFEARPPRAEKPIDPDNPFAALLALKGKV